MYSRGWHWASTLGLTCDVGTDNPWWTTAPQVAGHAAAMTTHTTHEPSLLDHTPRLAWYGGWISILVGIMNSLARFATEAGQQDVTALTRFWADPARTLLEPLLAFADVDQVYVIYGMAWGPLFLVALGCAVVVRRRRSESGMGPGERWAWRVYLSGFTLFTIGGFSAYYGAWISPAMIDGAFMALVIPGVLITLIGGTWLGIVLLRRGFRPRVTAVLLAMILPLVITVQMFMSLGSAFIPMLIAWGYTGRAISAEDSRRPAPSGVGAVV